MITDGDTSRSSLATASGSVRSAHRTSVDGKQEHFFTTKLEDATIVDIHAVLPHAQDASKAEYTQLIKTSLAYRKITWTHTVAGTEASDDWRKPQES